MNKTNVMVEFTIVGDEFDPHLITEKLKIKPTQYWIKGEQVRGRNEKIKRKETSWIISTGYEESLDINEQLEKIVELIKDKKTILKKLEMESNLEYIFGIVVNVENNEKPAMYFNRKFIEFANNINAEFYIDLYVY